MSGVDPKKRAAVTDLLTSGGPCGDGVKVSITQVSRNRAQLACSKCGARADVSLPGGRIDLTGLAALDDGVKRLHRRDT